MTEQQEFNQLHRRQDKELEALLDRKNTKRERHRMATRHVNEFVRLTKKWAKVNARKK